MSFSSVFARFLQVSKRVPFTSKRRKQECDSGKGGAEQPAIGDLD